MAQLAKCCFAVLLVLAGTAGSAWSRAVDHIVERAWMEDPSGSMTFSQVQSQPLKPFEGTLSKGYGSSVLWVRLRIDPRIGAGEATKILYLRIRPAYLDELTLYDPGQSSGPVAVTGDRFNFSKNVSPSTVHVFELPPRGSPGEVWVRLRTSSTRLAHFEVFSGDDLRQSNAGIELVGGLYLGLITVFIMWGVASTLLKPDLLLFVFVLYEVIALLFGACALGFARLLVGEQVGMETIDMATSILSVSSTIAVSWFSVLLLSKTSIPQWGRIGLYAICAVGSVNLGLLLLGLVTEALQINMILILLAPIGLLVIALSAHSPVDGTRHRSESFPKFVIVTYFASTLLFAHLGALPALGVFGNSPISMYIVFFYSVCSGLLMICILQYRNFVSLQHEQTLKAEAAFQAKRADQEHAGRVERDRLLAMLGHELKTPLGTMRMLLSSIDTPPQVSESMKRSLADMNNVVERSVQACRVEDGKVPVRHHAFNLRHTVIKACTSLGQGERIQLEFDEDIPAEVCTDAYLFELILKNLVENALKYSPPGSPVTVRSGFPADSSSKMCQICVDNLLGHAGWPDPQLVFSKFYRSPTASSQTGSGLGLFLVQGVSIALGGRVRYSPTDNAVRFVFEFPA